MSYYLDLENLFNFANTRVLEEIDLLESIIFRHNCDLHWGRGLENKYRNNFVGYRGESVCLELIEFGFYYSLDLIFHRRDQTISFQISFQFRAREELNTHANLFYVFKINRVTKMPKQRPIDWLIEWSLYSINRFLISFLKFDMIIGHYQYPSLIWIHNNTIMFFEFILNFIWNGGKTLTKKFNKNQSSQISFWKNIFNSFS